MHKYRKPNIINEKGSVDETLLPFKYNFLQGLKYKRSRFYSEPFKRAFYRNESTALVSPCSNFRIFVQYLARNVNAASGILLSEDCKA